MKVIVVHRPGNELPGAPLADIIEAMKHEGIRITLLPLKNVSSQHRGDLVFMYNSAYRVHQKKIDSMRTKVFNVPFSGYGKHRQYPFLKAGGVSIPDFEVLDQTSDVYDVVDRLGLPLITKPLIGSGGRGVKLHESAESVAKQIGREPIIAQRYVPEAGRGDIRALVIDGEVVASLWRTPREGNIASNFHSGGQPSKHNLTEEERVQAVKAAKSMGLALSGVDIVPTADGPLVFEANSLPDFMHMREVAGVDPIPALAAALRKAAESG
jgi:ribosomal protein S6--L-glutamate ligase